MISLDPNCEKTQFLGQLGYIYMVSNVGYPTNPIYRCFNTSSGDHFASTSSSCEGYTSEGLLGYTLLQGSLLRYYNGGDHFVTTARLTVGYLFEQSLGFMPLVPLPNTAHIFSCLVGGWDQMLSLDPNCESTQVLGSIGYLFTTPPLMRPYNGVYRCYVPATGDHFASNDPKCEGTTVEGLLGYSTTQPG